MTNQDTSSRQVTMLLSELSTLKAQHAKELELAKIEGGINELRY